MNDRNRKLALQSLSIVILLLFSAPKMSIKVGSLPIYLIDGLLFITFLLSNRLKNPKREIGNKYIVTFILFMIVLSELYAGFLMGTLVKPMYIVIRMLLAGSLFFSVNKIIQKENDLFKVLRAALIGTFVTSFLLIATSLPFTRPIVSVIFNISFLEPAAEQVVRKFGWYDNAIRGRSLVGVSILSGAFLNIIWPFLLLLQYDKLAKRWQRYLLRIVTFMVPIAVVMTYSRGAILGLLLVVFAMGIYQAGKNRRLIGIAVIGSLLLFSAVGWDSEYFFFSRIENRVKATFENPYEDERETERVYAYTEPFEHLIDNPTFLFVGHGFARAKVASHNLDAGGNAATHAVFAASYYAYGMITAITFVILICSAFWYIFRLNQKWNSSALFSTRLNRAALASLLGLLPWFMFGHAAVSQPRGTMVFFFLFGILSSTKNFVRLDWTRIKMIKEE